MIEGALRREVARLYQQARSGQVPASASWDAAFTQV